MSWNRKEVAGLLMVGAGFISALQTAIFSKWVDAKISTDADASVEIAKVVAEVGLASSLLCCIVWVTCRIVLNDSLQEKEKLSWKISSLFIILYLSMAAGWLIAVCK